MRKLSKLIQQIRRILLSIKGGILLDEEIEYDERPIVTVINGCTVTVYCRKKPKETLERTVMSILLSDAEKGGDRDQKS